MAKYLAGLGGLALAAFIAIQTGLAHRVFFELFAFVKGDGLVAPTVFRIPPANSPYERWLQQARRELPVFEGLFLHDIEHVGLRSWPQQGEGISGLYLRFADYQMTDGRLIEIPPGGRTNMGRHLYEIGVYVVSGNGYTMLEQEGQPGLQIDWSKSDLYSIPLNVRHGHYASGDQPVRLLMVTSFPMILNLMSSEDFIDQTEYVFAERFDGAADYLERRAELSEHKQAVNFIENVAISETVPDPDYASARQFMHWVVAGNSMLSMHVLEIPAKTRLRAHRHSSEAFILLLHGEGFSLAWPETSWSDRIRVNWAPGTLFVPPTYWYHQHFNSGSLPSRHLALNVPDVVTNLGLNFNNELEVELEQAEAEWRDALRKAEK